MSKAHITFEERTIELGNTTALQIYRTLRQPNSCLLQSGGVHETVSRYSYIGIHAMKQFKGYGQRLEEIHCATGDVFIHEGDMFELLRDVMPKVKNTTSIPMFGGLLGYIGYEVGHQPVHPKHDDLEAPDVWMNQYETIIAIDELKRTITLVQTKQFGVTPIATLDAIEAQIANVQHDETDVAIGQFTSEAKEEYEANVETIKRAIADGVVSQVVLSRRAATTIEGDPLTLYERLIDNNPSPYQFYFDYGTHQFFGASPESLVKVHAGQAIMNPIAGTRRRGATEREDEALAEELLQDEKELDEHDMLVEQAVDSLAQLCERETIHVTKEKELVKYEHVMHIVSEVEGTLRRGDEPIDALRLSFPAGTVTGEPKTVAMQMIDELETTKRGFFGGAIGYMSYASELDFALAIRSMMITDGRAYIQAGAGIVSQSSAAREFVETEEKMQSLVQLSLVEER